MGVYVSMYANHYHYHYYYHHRYRYHYHHYHYHHSYYIFLTTFPVKKCARDLIDDIKECGLMLIKRYCITDDYSLKVAHKNLQNRWRSATE